jgi:hypothetical protein
VLALAQLATQVQAYWFRLLQLLPYVAREIVMLLREEWENRVVASWGEALCQDGSIESFPLRDPKHAEACRTSAAAAVIASMGGVEDEGMALSSSPVFPVMFEHSVATRQKVKPSRIAPSVPKGYRGVHLFVLVHGFQGNSFDMRLYRNNIALLFPDAIFLCSNCNEEKTEGDIKEMGVRLAGEVANYVADWCPGSALGRLSFVAHSIGGLMVRAALPLLSEFSSRMHCFITLGTAHLGYLQATHLVNAGLFLLKKLRKSLCLQQLSMADADKPEDTFVWKLSQAQGMEHFEHIVLVSSQQDTYAPYDSARIEPSKEGIDSYKQMAQNILAPLDTDKIVRLDVDFKIETKNVDTFIGRAAHIMFLENQHLMRMLVHGYPKFFR